MSVDYYGGLVADAARIEAFRGAIEGSVRPEDRVLEVGTGLGTYAFFAARAGACRVVAVDASAVLHLAETLAAENGLADRIDFVRGSVPEVDLDGPFDLLLFEDFPVGLLDRRRHEMLRSLERDHLAADARMIPSAARLSLAPVSSEEVHRSLLPPVVRGGGAYGLDWEALRSALANRPRRMTLAPDSIRGVPVEGPRLALLPTPHAADLAVRGTWDAEEGGEVHALALWFDLDLGRGSWISNAPGPRSGPWRQWILPLDPPLPVGAGETLHAEVVREELDGGVVGWVRWEARTRSERRRGHQLGGLLLGPDALGRGGGEDRAAGNGEEGARVQRLEVMGDPHPQEPT